MLGIRVKNCFLAQSGQHFPFLVLVSIPGHGKTGQTFRWQLKFPPLHVHSLQGSVTSVFVSPSLYIAPALEQPSQDGHISLSLVPSLLSFVLCSSGNGLEHHAGGQVGWPVVITPEKQTFCTYRP